MNPFFLLMKHEGNGCRQRPLQTQSKFHQELLQQLG